MLVLEKLLTSSQMLFIFRFNDTESEGNVGDLDDTLTKPGAT